MVGVGKRCREPECAGADATDTGAYTHTPGTHASVTRPDTSTRSVCARFRLTHAFLHPRPSTRPLPAPATTQRISIANTLVASAAAPAIVTWADNISLVSRYGLATSLVLFGLITTGGAPVVGWYGVCGDVAGCGGCGRLEGVGWMGCR